ncbi:glutaredoxin family protein [Bacillus cereus]|uniref:glutaredoxin family protein n=1 Tax=Bacillus cereus TaxID=1396 RepID=UPI000B4AAA74|nr:glutaredoxin domain-containing protein [Bacillus cereus]
MANKIMMYTGNNCSKCKRAKEMFENLPSHIDVELVEINVDEIDGMKLYLTNILESNTLPTFTYEEIQKDGLIKIEVLRGFDENIGKIREHLGL